jgi:hypothetical protein
MLTVVICTVYPGMPESQLVWLSRQTCQDFELLLLDGYHGRRRHLAELAARLGLGGRFRHLPLLEQTNVAKRIDYTPRNNGCLLASYERVLFLDDHEYYAPNMIELALGDGWPYHYFYVNDLNTSAFGAGGHTVDLSDTYKPVTTVADDVSDAPIVDAPDDEVDPELVWNHSSHDRERLIYEFNGFNEAATAAYAWDDIDLGLRVRKRGIRFRRHFRTLYHFDHGNGVRSLRTPYPCCIFSHPKAAEINATRYDLLFGDEHPTIRYYHEDEYCWFLCEACGFSGPVDGDRYLEQLRHDQRLAAPVGWAEGRVGRNLSRLFEDLGSRSWSEKLELVESSYRNRRYLTGAP